VAFAVQIFVSLRWEGIISSINDVALRGRYETVVKRWPVILTQVIDQLHHTVLPGNVVELDDIDLQFQAQERATLIERITRLKTQMSEDHKLE
jgi:hypothetical protein